MRVYIYKGKNTSIYFHKLLLLRPSILVYIYKSKNTMWKYPVLLFKSVDAEGQELVDVIY